MVCTSAADTDGHDRLKPAAKKFAQKFATGASVSKNNEGKDEIVVQGDCSDELVDFMSENAFFKDLPADNIEWCVSILLLQSGEILTGVQHRGEAQERAVERGNA